MPKTPQIAEGCFVGFRSLFLRRKLRLALSVDALCTLFESILSPPVIVEDFSVKTN